LLVVAQIGTAHAADDKKSKAQQDRITKLQQIQQALQLEKDQLLEEKADAEKQVKGARGELERVRLQARKDAAQVAALQSELAALTNKLSVAEQALAKERDKLQALQTSFNQNQEQARSSARNMELQLAERNALLKTCEVNNAGLYKLNTELLGCTKRRPAHPACCAWGPDPVQPGQGRKRSDGLFRQA